MTTVYLAIKHPMQPYGRGGYLKAGTVEKASFDRNEITALVSKKNKLASYTYWSVRVVRVEEKT